MFGKTLPLFRAFGIEVNIHWSWLILALLVASSLAQGWFPLTAPGFSSTSYWMAGVLGTIGLFLSIVIHEFCHALVGHAYNMPMEKITLFLFGGVAHMEDEPPSPKAEFRMAIAGPLASVALAFVFYGLLSLLYANNGPPLLIATLSYLTSMNFVVAVFNMLPGYPLDGGRVLRSALWAYKTDIVWATRIASGIGQVFGAGLVLLGLFTIITGNGAAGLWPFLLGLMLIAFARTSYMQVVIKQTLQGQPVEKFMNTHPLLVSPNTPVSDLMRSYLQHDDQSVYPVVVDNHEFVGCVNLNSLKELSEEEWKQHRIGELTTTCEPDHKIAPETDAQTAFTRMSQTGYRELLVFQGNQLLGVLTRNALLRYLTLRESHQH